MSTRELDHRLPLNFLPGQFRSFLPLSMRPNPVTSSCAAAVLILVGLPLFGRLPSPPLEKLGASNRRSPFVISEVMYHPAPRSDARDTRFVEVYNSSLFPEDLAGSSLSGDIDFTFPAGTTVAARSFVVIARVPADIKQVYHLTNVFGPYTNDFNPAGLTVRLRNPSGPFCSKRRLIPSSFPHRWAWPFAGSLPPVVWRSRSARLDRQRTPRWLAGTTGAGRSGCAASNPDQ